MANNGKSDAIANNGAKKGEHGGGNKKKFVTMEEFELKINEMTAKMNKVTTSCNDRLDIMKDILDRKDQLISSLSIKVGKLENELENVKKSQNFVTNETSEIKKTMDRSFVDNKKKLEDLSVKTIDLEDRSRRDNIIIFGVPEESSEKAEDTERIITGILKKHGLIDVGQDTELNPVFHRVHRLGPKKEGMMKPRPIICKCVYFKDREMFLRSYAKLKGTSYNIAEDYSKPTLSVRRQLVQHAKVAMEKIEVF